MFGVSKISSTSDVMLVSIPQSTAADMVQVLHDLKQAGVVVDMISQTIPMGGLIHFCFTMSAACFEITVATIGRSALSPMISGGYSKINLFGEEMAESAGVAVRALEALQQNGTEIFLITTSDLDISLLVRSEDEDVALDALQAAYEIS